MGIEKRQIHMNIIKETGFRMVFIVFHSCWFGTTIYVEKITNVVFTLTVTLK